MLDQFFEDASDELSWVVTFILNVGVRGGDAVKAVWTDLEDGGLNVRQNKTGGEIWIPFTKQFAKEIAARTRKGSYVLAPAYSERWNLHTLRHDVQEQIEACGYKGYSLHGLRYNAAENLAQAGCSTRQIASITGHKTLAMVEKYTAKAEQKKLATTAIRKLQKGSAKPKAQ